MGIRKVSDGIQSFLLEKRNGIYLPYTTQFNADFGIVSPGLLHEYTQEELKTLYELSKER